MCWPNDWVSLCGVKTRRVRIKPFLIPATRSNRRVYLHTRLTSIFVGRPANSSPCFDPPLVNCEPSRLSRAPMPSCIPGSSRNWLPSSRPVPPPRKRFQRGSDGKIGTHFQLQSNSIGCTLPCGCCSFWITWQAITVTHSGVGVENTALDFCTRLVLVPGSTWPNQCSASLSGEPWRDTTSMMSKSSKTGFGTPSKDGIVILPRSSGEASGMRAVIGPMPVVTGKEDQELLPSMCFHDVFVPYAITSRLTFPSHMASDPLVQVPESSCVKRKDEKHLGGSSAFQLLNERITTLLNRLPTPLVSSADHRI